MASLFFFKNIPQLKKHAYDCRILVKEYGQPLDLGKEINNVPLIFLSPDDVFSYVSVGDGFELWERGIIGYGEIMGIENQDDYFY